MHPANCPPPTRLFNEGGPHAREGRGVIVCLVATREQQRAALA